MEKKNIDWKNLPFAYQPTDWRYVSRYTGGQWDDGKLTADADVTVSESAGIMQYCQQVFEGAKAFTRKDGAAVIFRPDQNALRMRDSALRMEMPPFDPDRFLDALDQVVKANLAWVPPYGSGASFYLRPYLFAVSPVLGVQPSAEYEFRVFGTPVGPYFKGGIRPLHLVVADLDRAAPEGTGHIKAGLNYAMSLHASVLAHQAGYDENLFTDPKEHLYVEETGGANFIFIDADGTLVTPKSDSILPSITRRSILYAAKNILHIPAEERKIRLDELSSFKEAGLCGTAAVISPVGTVNDHGHEIVFADTSAGMGPVTSRLYQILTGIQMGDLPAPAGWIHIVK